MNTPEEIRESLAQCHGTQEWYKLSILSPRMFYTQGVKALADMAGAYWLLDAIASHQPRCERDPMLRDIQFWTLKKREDGKWILICEKDTNDVAISQVIEYSDFPLPEGIKLYVEPMDKYMVILLPSEH